MYYIDQIMPLQVCFSALLLTEKLCSSCLYFFPLDQIEVALVFSDQNVEQLVRFSELLASSLSFRKKIYIQFCLHNFGSEVYFIWNGFQEERITLWLRHSVVVWELGSHSATFFVGDRRQFSYILSFFGFL